MEWFRCRIKLLRHGRSTFSTIWACSIRRWNIGFLHLAAKLMESLEIVSAGSSQCNSAWWTVGASWFLTSMITSFVSWRRNDNRSSAHCVITVSSAASQYVACRWIGIPCETQRLLALGFTNESLCHLFKVPSLFFQYIHTLFIFCHVLGASWRYLSHLSSTFA